MLFVLIVIQIKDNRNIMDNKAIKELNSDKLKAKNSKDYKELIKICNCLGRKYLQNHRYEEAIEEHNEELDISLRIGCRFSEAIARRALGECYSETNEYKKALTEHQKYLTLSETLGDQIEVQRAFATLGRTHLLRAQELYNNNEVIDKKILIEAKNCFLTALDKCQNFTELKDKELAEMRSRLYLNLGLVFELMGLFKESMTHLNLSIQLNQRYNLIEDLHRSQYSLASVYEKNNETEKALNAYHEAFKTANLLKNKNHSCDALIAKGIVLLKLRKFEESRKVFKKAFKLKSPIPEDREKSERCLIVSSFICDDFKELSKTDNLENKIKLCDRLGDHFVEFKLFEISIEFYKKELNFAVQCRKSDAEIAKIYVSIAQTYADDLKYEEAIKYFNHELDCNRGNAVEESKSLMKIAEMKEYLEREELNEEIVSVYEMAIEKIESVDNCPKTLFVEILQRFINFIESHEQKNTKSLQLKLKLNLLKSQNEDIMETDEAIAPDIYDSFDLNQISDCSTDSDDEMPSKGRRIGKTLKRNEKGETPLHIASIEGNVKQVRRLLIDKYPVNVRDYSGWTPLHEAANNGHKEVVELLLQSGANIDDNEGENIDAITPLHDACSNGHFDVIRVLLNNGAKVTLLTNTNETALDLFRAWMKRSSEELDENDLKDFDILEKQLEEALNKEGFVRKNIPVLKPRQPRIHFPLIRGRDSSPDSDDSDVRLNGNQSPRIISTNVRNNNEKTLDFDDPKTARQEYCSTILSFRRNPSNKTTKSQPKPKPNAIPALLDGSHVVNDDQWLIKDLNETKKRSCVDAYDAMTKKSKTDEPIRRNRKHKTQSNQTQELSTNLRTFDENSENSIEVSDNECIEDLIVCEETTESPTERNDETLTVNNNSEDEDNNQIPVDSIQLRVSVLDIENTSFVIPILDKNSDYLWLKKEVEKRYFNKYGGKPIISLETIDGALLSDEDNILDVIKGDELKVTAKIDSWILDPLNQRYEEICNSCGVKPMPEMMNELQVTQMSGCLTLSDINIPVQQIKPIFRALQRQNNFREMDISCSNVIFDDAISFFGCLSHLPSLKILNLKCTALNLQGMEQLATKCFPDLVDLNISFNSFGDYFIEVILRVIQNFPELKVIDLTACDLTDKFVESNQLNEYIKKSNLRSIVLDFNRIDSELIDKFLNI